jgi:hypothetical protein
MGQRVTAQSALRRLFVALLLRLDRRADNHQAVEHANQSGPPSEMAMAVSSAAAP